MEPTIINGSDVTVEGCDFGMSQIRITQPDDDIVVLHNRDAEEFITAVRKHAGTVEEVEPTPEKWYVVLKNSNMRLLTHDEMVMVFMNYVDASSHAQAKSVCGRRYCPISTDEYESAFGR